MRRTNEKFSRRFRAIEQYFVDQGKDLADVTLDEMEEQWVAIKRREKTDA